MNLKYPILILGIFLLLSILTTSKGAKSSVIEVRTLNLKQGQSHVYEVESLDIKKRIVVLLKLVEDIVPDAFSDLEVILKSKDKQLAKCVFNNPYNLCVAKEVTQAINITFKCLEQVCSYPFEISQRKLVDLDSVKSQKQILNSMEVYKIGKREHNSLITINSAYEEYSNIWDNLDIYANVETFNLGKIEQLDQSNAIIGIKSIRTETQQYFCVQKNKNKKEGHFSMTLSSNINKVVLGQNIVDFIDTNDKKAKNNYIINNTFTHNAVADLRIFAPRDNSSNFPIKLSVYGLQRTNDSKKTLIKELKLQKIQFNGNKIYDFVFWIDHKFMQQHKTFEFIISSSAESQVIFFELEVSDSKQLSIRIFDNVFFAGEKSDTLNVKVESEVKLQLSTQDQNLPFITTKNYSVNAKTCSLQNGCEFQITVKKSCNVCKLALNLSKVVADNNLIYHKINNNLVEGRIDLEEEIYFSYTIKANSSVELIVNSLNVIVYANFENYARCSIPAAECHQYVINRHNPTIIKNKNKNATDLHISIVGLEKTSFQLKLINEDDDIHINLGEKFSYLLDDEDEEIEVKLKLDLQKFRKQKQKHLTFNLISPLHSLTLQVENQDGIRKTSSEGYITYLPDEIHQNDFKITIHKPANIENQFIHFTLVASTGNIAIQLDASVTHYQKYLPKTTKTYIVEYDPISNNALSINTEQLQKLKGKMKIQIRNIVQEGNGNLLFSKDLIKNSQFINIDEAIDESNECEDRNCELEITIASTLDVQIQQSITVLAQQSILYLEDSLWLHFEVNQLTIQNHFYFIPNNKNKPINILFRSDDKKLFVDYRIFEALSINPQDWPFSHQKSKVVGNYIGTQEIKIEPSDPRIIECQPNCVILINVNAIENFQSGNIESQNSKIKYYSILATNNIIQLPEDTKLQFILRNGQEKNVFIAIKNFIKSDMLTFFTYFTVGRAKITASISYKNKKYLIISGDEENDVEEQLVFNPLQTSISMLYIKKIIQEKKLQLDDVLLKISIIAQNNVKMNIQFSSYLRDIYNLKLDDLQVVNLQKTEDVIYQFIPERDFSLKMYRISGFAFFKIIKCQFSDYIKCLNSHKKLIKLQVELMNNEKQKIEKPKTNLVSNNQSQKIVDDHTIQKEKSLQQLDVMIEKSLQFEEQQCPKCIYYLWIYCFEGDLQLTLNLRSRATEIEMKQQVMMQQHLEPQKQNKYLINAEPNAQTIITIRIFEGKGSVEIADSYSWIQNYVLSSTSQYYKDIIIPPIKSIKKTNRNSENKLAENAQDLNAVFRHLHVTVKNIGDEPLQFLIHYSNGQMSLNLEDGVVVTRQTNPSYPTTYYYQNTDKSENPYLTISSQALEGFSSETPSAGNELEVRFYHYSDISDKSTRQQFIPQAPPKRNQNYLAIMTTVYQLPAKFQMYEIQILTKSYLKLTLSVFHKELIYLPLEFEYLIKLHRGQILNLVVDTPQQQFLLLQIKKCDESTPLVKYTNNAQDFKHGIFNVQKVIEQKSYKDYIQTLKNSNTIHIKLQGDTQTDNSFITIMVRPSNTNKIREQKAKAGNYGLIQYQFVTSTSINVTFKPVVCGNNPCKRQIAYFYILSSTWDSIYKEISCAGHYFASHLTKLKKEAPLDIVEISKIYYNQKIDKYEVPLFIKESHNFIGIKAIIFDETREDIFYGQVEIVSFWNNFTKLNASVYLVAGAVIILVLTIVIVLSTTLARRGYKQVSAIE